MGDVSAVAQMVEAAAENPARLGIVQSRPMTYEEFLAWAPEGGLTEWIDGEGVQYMPATNVHQRVVNLLIVLLTLYLSLRRLGKVYSGPYALRAKPDGNAREPDVFVVTRDNPGQESMKAFVGPADVVVEVISDDSVFRDRVTKFDEYEAAGVREYWLIDPRPGRNRAEFYVLDTAVGRYRPASLEADRIFRSAVLPGFWLDVEWLWQESPNVAEIYETIRSSQ
ncbi:MAG: Uma2 family endonuclease [Thermoflexales bacterium]|nr:Uma2 family endonuclease [Thermoflexales bacterium]